ncbi:NlpC/P60 family protein [Niallia taxi]|nr:NlpC/P60 family protein [Niallia taxi]MDE5055371.1 NlpC/P60 family protein [Niallia taxi]
MKKIAAICLSVGVIGTTQVSAEEQSQTVSDHLQSNLNSIEYQVAKMDKEINAFQNERIVLERHLKQFDKALEQNQHTIKKEQERLETITTRLETIKKQMKELDPDGQFNKMVHQDLMKGITSITTVNKQQLLLENVQKVSQLFALQEELKEASSELESNHVELEGMISQLQEQQREKEKLVEQLKQKEETSKKQKKQLLEESKKVEKEKELIEGAISNEEERAEKGSAFFGQSNIPSNATVNSPSIDTSNTTIPSKYMKYYLYGEKEYGVPWYYLAAIHSVETSFSTSPTMTSSVGAIGSMQFMPSTWVGYKYESSGGLVAENVDITDLETIKKGNGYGVDADNDGKADPYSVADGVAAAANYLSSNGFATDPRKAIWHYNHAEWYVDKVINLAENFKNSTHVSKKEDIQLQSGGEYNITTVGNRWIGNSVYVFGGGRNQSDVKNGRFDCSSFVYWAYNQLGVKLGEQTSVSTETLKNMGTAIEEKDMEPGDLVFFDTYKKDGHVGIYIGDGKFIGAQSSNGVAIEDMTSGYWKEKFNHRVQRVANI